MAETENLRFRKGDWLAVALVILIAVSVMLCFLPKRGGDGGQAQIYLGGELIKTVPLSQDQTFLVEDRFINEITVADGAIFFSQSDCPGHDCVHSGSIRSTGRVLVCLPNGVEIRVVSQVGDVDFVVG